MKFTDYCFDVMWKDDVIASVSITNNRKDIKIKKFNNDIYKQPFMYGKMDLDRVYQFISYRCFEEGRGDKEELLELLGLEEYNPWEIIKKTHGRLFEDYLWVRFPEDNIKWEDISYGQL